VPEGGREKKEEKTSFSRRRIQKGGRLFLSEQEKRAAKRREGKNEQAGEKRERPFSRSDSLKGKGGSGRFRLYAEECGMNTT